MKNKVIIQALILATGQIGGKILSLIFLFRLSSDIRPIGLYLYTYAYIPFSLFMDCSSWGFIPGVAKYISRIIGKKEIEKLPYILKLGTIFSLIIGFIFFILINIFNEKILSLSLYSGYTIEEYNIILSNMKIASISLIIYPLLSFYKGYLQGHLKMFPSAISIIIENLVRTLLYIYISNNINISTIQNIFIINFISYLVALLSISIFVIKDYFKKGIKFPFILSLLRVTIPIGTVTMFYTFYQLIDTMTLSSLGVDSNIYSAYMFESIRLIFVPIILAQSVGGSLNPRFNNLCINEKYSIANKMAKRITNLMIKLLIPMVFFYIIYAKDIFKYYYDSDLYYILADTAILIFFIGFYKVIIGITQGMKKFKYISITTFISVIAKIILNIIFVPKLSYSGAILSTITAISICLCVSYYILAKSKINIFFSNIKNTLLVIIAVYAAGFIATIFKASFFTNVYSSVIEVLLFFILFLLFYLLFISFFNIFNRTKINTIA